MTLHSFRIEADADHNHSFISIGTLLVAARVGILRLSCYL